MSDFSEQERLRQLELELEQATAAAAGLQSSSQGKTAVRAWAKWGRPLLTVLAILGCIFLVGLAFRLFGALLKGAVVAGLGYLLYAWVVAPRLGLPTGARPKAEDRDLDSF